MLLDVLMIFMIMPNIHGYTGVMSEALQDNEVQMHLGRLAQHHYGKAMHSVRTACLCYAMGELLGFDYDQQIGLCCSGLLHDIGFIDTPTNILTKDSELTEAEFGVIKMHPRSTFERLKYFKHPDVPKVAVAHHEFQRDSYPRTADSAIGFADRRSNNDHLVPFQKILAVADKFDAILHEREYKPPFPTREAERIIRDDFTGEPLYIDLALSCLHTY